jgi:hypothetical protein
MSENGNKIDPDPKTVALVLAKEAYLNVLEPGLKPLSQAIGTLAEVVNTALIPLDLLNKRASLWKEGIVAGMTRNPNVSSNDLARTLTAMESTPLALDSSLEDAWKNLIASSIVNDPYHPTLPKILSELSGSDLRLLQHIIELSKNGIRLAPDVIHSDLPAEFYIDKYKKVDTNRLSISFTSLEKQSLISTSNNLGSFFQEKKSNDQVIDPTGHQVTPLGYLLYETCNKI